MIGLGSIEDYSLGTSDMLSSLMKAAMYLSVQLGYKGYDDYLARTLYKNVFRKPHREVVAQ